MKDGLSPQQIVDKLDALSRGRALTLHESLTLERAIHALNGGERCTKRDAARAGLRRDMGAYRTA